MIVSTAREPERNASSEQREWTNAWKAIKGVYVSVEQLITLIGFLAFGQSAWSIFLS